MSQVTYRGNQYDTEAHKAEVQAELCMAGNCQVVKK